jgi:hypothetical protein
MKRAAGLLFVRFVRADLKHSPRAENGLLTQRLSIRCNPAIASPNRQSWLVANPSLRRRRLNTGDLEV